jgi:hypothetical protein
LAVIAQASAYSPDLRLAGLIVNLNFNLGFKFDISLDLCLQLDHCCS